MNLISCNHCGVVLDLNNIVLPETEDNEGERINSEWAEGSFMRTFPCPTCSSPVLTEEEE